MADLKAHPFDLVADEITRWIDEESSWYAQALTEGYKAPFAAPASEAEKLEHYRKQMYHENPDGSIDYDKPNLEERTKLFQRVGAAEYARIASATSPNKTAQHLETLDSDVPPSEEY